MRKNFLARRGVAVLLALAMVASLMPAALAADPAPSLSLDETALTLKVNETGALKLTVNSVETGYNIEWSSSDETVAAVSGDENGATVTAKAKGEAEITAAYVPPAATTRDAVSVVCKVTVNEDTTPPPVNPSITISHSAFSVEVGKTVKLDAKVTGTTSAVTWSSDNTRVATVNNSGTVTGVAEGTVTITASAGTASVSVRGEVTPATFSDSKITSWNPTGPIILSSNGTSSVRVTREPSNAPLTWTILDENHQEPAEGAVKIVDVDSSGRIVAQSPGRVYLIAQVGDGTGPNQKTEEIEVVVSGIAIDLSAVENGRITIMQNEEFDLTPLKAKAYGSANGVRFSSNDNYVAEVVGSKVIGYELGETTIVVSDTNGNYKQMIPVTVVPDPSTTIEYKTVLKPGDTLPFSKIWGDFNEQLSGTLVSVVGLNVPTEQGTLYYRYSSEAQPGEGVASQDSYYVDSAPGRRLLEDITFVPKSTFIGGQVRISYTGITQTGTYSCNILLTVDPGTGGASGGNLSLSTRYNTAVRFSAADFNSACQERLGVSLSSVTFSMPPLREGSLYTNYVSASNYGSAVTSGTQYSRRNIDDIWFVPAPGFTGTTTVYFTARGTGSGSAAYAGQLTIYVSPENGVSTGGVVYNTTVGGAVTFNDTDFNSYSQDITPGGGATLNYIQFTALPSASQGRLYYDYRTSYSTGSSVSTGTSYYYGTRTPRIDRITFVPAADFIGTVRIPFNGWDQNGSRLAGNVEINVRSSSGSGDIRYTCGPNQTVYFKSSDFTDLSRKLTDRTLNYIIFQSLPSSSDGYLYYNNSRLTNTNSQYSSSRINSLSFRASSSFSGSVDIPFIGYATGGESFRGVVTVDSSGISDWTIHYSTNANSAAVFKRTDFDDLSQWETDRGINFIRFEVPSTTQGDLYRNYSSSSSKGTRLSSNTTSIYASDLNRLAFVPNRNFSGIAYLDFTARSLSGDSFQGTVEITVNPIGTSDWTIHYATSADAAAVFRRSDFDDLSQLESGRNINYIRFEIPSTTQGDLYRSYYSSSSKGSRISSSSTSVYGSDLNRVAFIPNKSFVGTAYVDFTATSLSGDTFRGTVEIEVSRAAADVTASYSTRTSPVRFVAADLARRNYTLSSIRIDALPASSAGTLYYQYTSPTRYGQQVASGSTYRVSGSGSLISDLTFVPRAGFTGTAYIPYTGTNSNGSTFTGEVQVTVSPVYSSSYFTDMGSGYTDAQRAAVDFLYDQNITRGVSANQYGPESAIRRGDFARMIYLAFDLTPTSNTNAFWDVPSSAYYAEAVNALYARGIVSGVGGGSFAPNSTLTRQDAVCMVQRAMRTVGWNASDGYSTVLSGYSDGSSVSGYAQGAMSFALQKGYLPVSNSQLNPKQPLSRVDMAVLLHRVLTYN